MNEEIISISTRQASELLGVHESSVKRWCNAEELECWLTRGGHRRIPVVALVSFADRQGIALPLLRFAQDAGQVWAGLEDVHRHGSYDKLVTLTYGWIEQGWSSPSARLIEYLTQQGLRLGQVMDRLVRPVMHRVGHGYLEGTLSIGDEHLMTQTMRDVLVTLSTTTAEPLLSSNGNSKPVAIVGCVRGEVHELGALMVRPILEDLGWRVVYLGLNVPTEEFAAQQFKHGASLVCISMMPPMGMTDALTATNLLDRIYDPATPYRLVLGGSALKEEEADARTRYLIPEVRFFHRIEPFSDWAQALPD